jgi:hypothetical protein
VSSPMEDSISDDIIDDVSVAVSVPLVNLGKKLVLRNDLAYYVNHV